MSENDTLKLIEELFSRILAKETETFREQLETKILTRRILVQMVKLNAAMDKLNYISGGDPKLTVPEIEKQLNITQEYEKELRGRLDKLALESK